MLVAVLALVIVSIAVLRPLDFLDHSGVPVPRHFNFVQRLVLIYSSQFANITKPYLFPYSLYIIGLWCCMALPVLLALGRSIGYDFLDYVRLHSALRDAGIAAGATPPPNAVALYRRKAFDCFDFINVIAKRYALFMLPIIGLGYIEEYYLSCSVLAGATNTGKVALLVLSMSSLGAVLYLFLKLHYNVRRTALAGIGEISDSLAKDPARASELSEATTVTEEIRKKDGLAELWGVFRGAGIVGIVGGLFWTYVLGKNLCTVAKAIFPDPLVDTVAAYLNLRCR